jgi:non-ribosomal peptide synthetase component E (peptide arylation enzyme)
MIRNRPVITGNTLRYQEQEHEQIVPVGERGELCYRGFVVMAGYYKMPRRPTRPLILAAGRIFAESYPLTASGKVQKFILREQAIRGLGLEEMAKIKTA